ncbi:MAG: TolC family protein [Bacteroidota bacterium]|nr:TolC family protein [Bacteroidota bacterium]
MIRFILIFLLAVFVIQNPKAQNNIDFYIDKALQNSPLLKDYQNQVRANYIDSMRIRAGLLPQVNAISNSTWSPVISGWGHDEVLTNGANINALLSVSKEIVSRQNLQNQYQAIRLQSQSVLVAGKISEQDLKKSVTEQYITTYGTWQLYGFNNDLLTLLKKEEQLFKKLAEQGVYKQTEYLSFLVTLQQQELQVAQIKNQCQNNAATLNYLCGIVDTASQPLSAPKLNLADLPEFQGSVFSQQFIIDSLKITNSDKQVDLSYKPKLNVFGDAGYYSSLAYQPWKNWGTTIGLNFSMPIYDGHQRKIQHDKNTIAEQTRQSYRDFYVKQYRQQINRLLQQLQANQQLAEQITKQIKYAQVLIDADRKLLETGDVRVTDYIIAINNYLNAKNTLVQNLIDKYQIINQINYWSRKK